MRTPWLLLLALAGAAAPAGGRAEADDDPVRGDGDKVTEERRLAGFTRIGLSGPVDVEVTEGSGPAVSVTIDRNLQPFLTTAVNGDVLVIGTSRSLRYRGPGKVVVSLPELHGFDLEGSGDVRIAGAERDRDVALRIDGSGDLGWSGRAGKLEARIRGSGDLRIRGAAGKLEATIEGSGDIAARELRARSARLAIEGSGDIEATLDGGALSATVEGSGDILWRGRAEVEVSTVRGSGSISHR